MSNSGEPAASDNSGMLVICGSYLLLRPPVRSLLMGPVSDVCAGFLGGITGGLAGDGSRFSETLVLGSEGAQAGKVVAIGVAAPRALRRRASLSMARDIVWAKACS